LFNSGHLETGRRDATGVWGNQGVHKAALHDSPPAAGEETSGSGSTHRQHRGKRRVWQKGDQKGKL